MFRSHLKLVLPDSLSFANLQQKKRSSSPVCRKVPRLITKYLKGSQTWLRLSGLFWLFHLNDTLCNFKSLCFYSMKEARKGKQWKKKGFNCFSSETRESSWARAAGHFLGRSVTSSDSCLTHSELHLTPCGCWCVV